MTPQLYHSDEDDHDEIQSQYSNELSQLRKIDKKTLLVKPGYQFDALSSITDWFTRSQLQQENVYQ